MKISKIINRGLLLGMVAVFIFSTSVFAANGDLWKGNVNKGNIVKLLLHDKPTLFDLIRNISSYGYEVNGNLYNTSAVNQVFSDNQKLSPSDLDKLISSTLAPISVVKTPTYDDPELVRAVSLGIGAYADNEPISYNQFFQMLDVIVGLANPTVLPVWKNEFPDARVSNNTMLRQEGMLAILYAAEALGQDYNVTNSDWVSLNKLIGDSIWKDFTFDYPLFPGWDQPVKLGTDNWNNHMIAAYFYSMGRTSVYSGALIFDYDSIKNSMRPADPFTYEEALLAALRLFDSGQKATARVLTAADTEILNRADARRTAILNSKTEVTITGTSYYVSNSGNDKNDGLSPTAAWATLDKVNNMDLKSGDGVFFERGGLWRGSLYCKDSVTYTAYGVGDKPKIYASPENGADPAKWKLLDGTNNIWVFYKNMPDCGSVVFNDGNSCAEKTIPFWNGKEYVDYVNADGAVMKADIAKLDNLHYICKVDLTGEALPVYMWEKSNLTGPLYLRCDEGNPGTVYRSIEFSVNTPNLSIVSIGAGNTIDNLCVKYGADNGIGFGTNTIIQNCEVAWVGGITHRYYYEDGKPCVSGAGDGINLSNYGNGALNNYVHQCYDNGIIIGEAGFLGWYSKEDDLHMGNLTARGNLVENCNSGLQLAIWEKYDGVHIFKNTIIDNNYVLYMGYGWSHDRHIAISGKANTDMGSDSLLIPVYSSNEGTYVTNNVFYISKAALLWLPMAREFLPNFSGNTYVQNNLGWLYIFNNENPPWHIYDLNAQKNIKNVIGDKTGIVLPLN